MSSNAVGGGKRMAVASLVLAGGAVALAVGAIASDDVGSVAVPAAPVEAASAATDPTTSAVSGSAGDLGVFDDDCVLRIRGVWKC
jgi:hypothetical protein